MGLREMPCSECGNQRPCVVLFEGDGYCMPCIRRYADEHGVEWDEPRQVTSQCPQCGRWGACIACQGSGDLIAPGSAEVILREHHEA